MAGPDAIFESVAIRRELIEGVTARTELERLMAKFIGASFYSSPLAGVSPATLNRMHDDVLRQMTKEFLPFARDVGREAAKPILEAIPSGLVGPGTKRERRASINRLRTFGRKNLAVFRAGLARDVGTLSDSVNVAFAEAARDNVAKKTLIDQLVAADRAEHLRLVQINREIDTTAKAVQDAEETLETASNRARTRARKDLRANRKNLTKAKAKLNPSRFTSFYARFETAVQGSERDAIRRESEMAMRMEFARRGYTKMIWVAVNGSDACPSCADRHGGEYTLQEAAVDGPGAGGTYCGGACMCVLVPQEYTQGDVSLVNPLSIVGHRREPTKPVPTLNATGRSTGRPPKAIKLGGGNAAIAKRAKKRREAQERKGS